jgi:hypothetical protein
MGVAPSGNEIDVEQITILKLDDEGALRGALGTAGRVELPATDRRNAHPGSRLCVVPPRRRHPWRDELHAPAAEKRLVAGLQAMYEHLERRAALRVPPPALALRHADVDENAGSRRDDQTCMRRLVHRAWPGQNSFPSV